MTTEILILQAFLIFYLFNTLKPEQNGRHFTENIFKCISLNENICILIQILV